MVAKVDSNNNIIILDYDNIYRLSTIKKVSTANYGDPLTTILNEGQVGTSGSLLLENTYLPGKMWMSNTKEGILRNGGVNGEKTTNFQYDIYGRVINTISDYGTGIGTVEQWLDYNSADLMDSTITYVNALGQGADTLIYDYSYDTLLRSTTTELIYNNKNTLLDSLGYDVQDRVSQKYIGGGLQLVDYTYDDAGKLIYINSPNEHQCVKEINVCQLYWGSAGSMDTFDSDSCGTLVSVTFDGTTYTAPSPIPSNNALAMEWFVDSIITVILKLGECEVHYQNIAGLEELHFSIMNTNILTGQLQFTNCTYTFHQKNCCTITAIDPSQPIVPTTKPDLFFENIVYDGMDISRIEMAGNCDMGLIINEYAYDADHRVTKVQNQLYQPFLINDALSTTYSYDPAGNIQSLTRRGWVQEENQFMDIDNMTYTYVNGSSMLEKIVDNIGPTSAQQKGFGRTNPISNYGYDGNGNMITDDGKGITDIVYNLLNLPENISIGGNSIIHEYTFSGEKIKKFGEEETIYIGGFEYRNDTLLQINIPNGRILKDTLDHYQFSLTDHLGNVVVVFEDMNNDGKVQQESEVVQRNHYYTFGLRVDMPQLNFGSSNSNRYLYNGKELADDFGLDWLDFGFRYYDSPTGRFPSVDPIADEFVFVSPFNYAENSPVRYIDLWGLQKAEGNGNAKPVQGTDQYKIQKGDNLTKLSKTHNTTVNDLLIINPQIEEKKWIYEGELMNVPMKNAYGSSQIQELLEQNAIERKTVYPIDLGTSDDVGRDALNLFRAFYDGAFGTQVYVNEVIKEGTKTTNSDYQAGTSISGSPFTYTNVNHIIFKGADIDFIVTQANAPRDALIRFKAETWKFNDKPMWHVLGLRTADQHRGLGQYDKGTYHIFLKFHHKHYNLYQQSRNYVLKNTDFKDF